MKVLGLGLSGLVGSRVTELLVDTFTFEQANLETGFDITNKLQTEALISTSEATWVFHFAAFTNVDASEKERDLGENSLAWKVNAEATKTIAQACLAARKRLLYVSTDYVFDGNKAEYFEEDEPNPQSWYGITKYEGEKRVMETGDLGLIIRIANPYRRDAFAKPDFVHKIISELSQGHSIKSSADQLFVPTFIDDIAGAIKVLVQQNLSGIFHVVGSSTLSPYEAALAIAGRFSFDPKLVQKTTFAEYFAGRAPRPFQAVLRNDKITKLGVKMRTFAEGLALVSR